MTLPVYPSGDVVRGLGYSQKWSPAFFNMPTATTATGADIDLAISQYPLHDFELTYEFLRDGLFWSGRGPNATLEFKTMMGFHLMLGGTVGRFLFLNIDDCQVSRNQIGVGDGVTTTFTLTRTFGAQGYFGSEPIGQLIPGAPFNAYVGGSATPTNPTLYTLGGAPCANTITFSIPPSLGQSVQVDMQYYYYCKLADNSNTFEKFMNRLWELAKVKLHSCRPGA